MSLSSLIPLAGAAVAPVLGKVIDGVTEGFSFLDVLHTQTEDGVDEVGEATESNALQQNIAELADRLRERFAQLGKGGRGHVLQQFASVVVDQQVET